MAVYKRGKTYWYEFWFNGTRYRGSTKVRSIDKARQVEAKRRTDLGLGIFGLVNIGTSPTFQKFTEDKFLPAVRVRSKDKARTVQFYEEKTRRLLEFKPIADARLHLIEGEIVERYIQFRAKKGRKPAAINRELATLHKALNLAHEWKLIPRRPKISMLPGEVGRTFVLGYDLEKIYLEKADQPLQDVALLILDTGLRLGEAVSLPWEAITQDSNGEWRYLTVQAGKSANARRSVPLSDRCRAMLTVRRGIFPDSPWIYPGQRKGKHLTVWAIDNLHADLRRNTADDHGRPVFPETFVVHSLRHTFGTRLGETGANPYQIMKLMGHSSLAVSQKYVHPTAGGLETVMKNLEVMNRTIRGEVPTKVPTVTKTGKSGSVTD